MRPPELNPRAAIEATVVKCDRLIKADLLVWKMIFGATALIFGLILVCQMSAIQLNKIQDLWTGLFSIVAFACIFNQAVYVFYLRSTDNLEDEEVFEL